MVIMSILFFMVGFITTMNNSLIDFLSSSKWMLSFSEKQLVNTAFFGAYLFSIPLSYLLNKLGYKASAVLSLFVVGVGFILTYPAVTMGYVPFLISMFLVASGIALLQIVLNPYVLALGSQRGSQPPQSGRFLQFCSYCCCPHICNHAYICRDHQRNSPR